MNDFNVVMHFLALFIFIYGIRCGARNWGIGIVGILKAEPVIQSNLGKVLDWMWLFSVIILVKNGYMAMLWSLI